MIVVRNVFRLKFGKAKEAVALLKEGIAIQKRAGVEMNQRIMTDLVGTFYTLVLELTIPNLAALEADMPKAMGDKDLAGHVSGVFCAGRIGIPRDLHDRRITDSHRHRTKLPHSDPTWTRLAGAEMPFNLCVYALATVGGNADSDQHGVCTTPAFTCTVFRTGPSVCPQLNQAKHGIFGPAGANSVLVRVCVLFALTHWSRRH